MVVPVQGPAGKGDVDAFLIEQLRKGIVIVAGDVQVLVFWDITGHFRNRSPRIQDNCVVRFYHGNGKAANPQLLL